MAEFADSGSLSNILAEGETKCPRKRKKSIKLIRKKRLQRKQKKIEDYKNMSKRERRSKIKDKLSVRFEEEISALEQKLGTTQKLYKKEKQISAYCWKKWKKENRVNIETHSNIKRVRRENLYSNKDHPLLLGKGSFGKCMKMEYRGITVAVKQFEPFVTSTCVLWEASVINQFDHPGLPLLLGISLSKEPLLLVTQFHGVNGNCVTLASAKKITLLEEAKQWSQMFVETAEALQYIHDKGFLHNDIKGDNVLITKDCNYHPVIIDFGKSKKIKDAKLYRLNKQEQKNYQTKYWHIAPELVKGTHKQSDASDVFSFGVMMKSICDSNNNYKNLKDIAKQCTNENPGDRLSLRGVKDMLYKII